MDKKKKPKIANSILDLIGNTPLVRLNKISAGCHAHVLGKLECLNPGGSVKDRLGLAMIESGEKDGTINKDTVLMEATSGNTGIGLAMAAAVKGYRLIIAMPETNPVERRRIMKGFGAELKVTPGAEGIYGSIAKIEELQKENPNSVFFKQFDHPANVQIHRKTTAEEIWNDTNGEVDMLVAGIGTGGTLTGVSEIIKKRKPGFQMIAVEPTESPILSGGKPGPHTIYGIGPPFIPSILNVKLIDEVFKVTGKEALDTTKKLIREEGIFAGISAGANVFAAVEIAKRPENKGKTIVAIICDPAERYLSTELFM